MPRLLAFLLLAVILITPAGADVPERFHGTWALDKEATQSAIEAAELTAEQQDRLLGGIAGELADLSVEITASAMTYNISGQSMTATLTLEEESADRAVFSSPEADAVTLLVREDGLLNTRSSKDDDFDHFYFARQDDAVDTAAADTAAEDTAEAGPSTDAVAYLDALKTCSPGEFHLSFSGTFTFENTIVGKKGDRCELRIVYPEFNLTCEYSERMIELLTSEKMYEEARTGVLSGSTDSEISQLASEQCLSH